MSMAKKLLLGFSIVCFPLGTMNDCLAAPRYVSHQNGVYIEITLLVSSTTAGILFYVQDPKNPDIQIPQHQQVKNNPGKIHVSLNIFKHLWVSPERIILIEW
jgi:hypothetical protein